MSNIDPNKSIHNLITETFDFADVLQAIRVYHYFEIQRKPGLEPYQKAPSHSIYPDDATMEFACKADIGASLLAALNLRPDASIVYDDKCDQFDLWEHTGYDFAELNNKLASLEKPVSRMQRKSVVAQHVLKIHDPYPRHLQRCFRVSLHDKRRCEFADAFPSFSKMINSVGLGWSGEFDGNWTIPERNGYGTICNFLCFDSKFNIQFRHNPRRMGLILPLNCWAGSRPLYVVDDPKEMLRALASRHRVICRQAGRQSLVDLANFLRPISGNIFLFEPADRSERAIEDANYLSETLSGHLGRKILVVRGNPVTSAKEVSKSTEAS